jgi:hypothetical protein
LMDLSWGIYPEYFKGEGYPPETRVLPGCKAKGIPRQLWIETESLSTFKIQG